MNKIYRTVYNETTQTWVAVSELDTGHIRTASAGNTVPVASMAGFALRPLLLALGLMLGGLSYSPQTMAAIATCQQNSTSENWLDFSCGPNASALTEKSVALGNYAQTSGSGSSQQIAIGNNVRATGNQAIAIGNDMIATGVGAIAIGGDDIGALYDLGYGYIAGRGFGNTGSTDNQKYRATAALGQGSVAVGGNAQTLATGATAIGPAATAGFGTQPSVGTGGTVSPWTSISGREATAVGAKSYAKADQSTAIGFASQALSKSSVAIGDSNVADNTGVVLQEVNNRRGGASAAPIPRGDNGTGSLVVPVVVGAKNNTATGGVAVGANNVVGGSGFTAFAFGHNNDATNGFALALGIGNTANSSSAIAVGTANQSNGNTSIAVGRQSQAASDFSLAMGNVATANAVGAMAVGHSANASAARAIAIGSANTTATQLDTTTQTQATGIDAVAVGTSAKAGALNTIAIGKGAQATGSQSISIGTGNVVSGANSGALGDPSIINGANSYSVGNNNVIGKLSNNVFVLGNNVQIGATRDALGVVTEGADTSGAVALGNGTSVTQKGGVALGENSAATVASGVAGYDSVSGKASADSTGTWKATNAAVSVGKADGSLTRQITGLAAGTANTDAVNVAQLKNAQTHYYSVNDKGTPVSNYANDGAKSANDMAIGPQAYAKNEVGGLWVRRHSRSATRQTPKIRAP